MNQKRQILNFLKCLSENNYNDANKYLQQIVNEKIKTRISKAMKSVKPF
jgi:hypothetical protein